MLFVTGMPRCGTTLIEKLLSHHAAVSLLSQPFPFLFLDAKRAFLNTIGRGADAYPLGDLFLEAEYTPDDFRCHLRGRTIEPETVRSVFAAMEGYSGQYTKFDGATLDRVFARLPASDLASTVGALYAALSADPAAQLRGGKETGCEEFLPYLIERGARCLVIVRDPRDMLASLNHGQGPSFAGAVKPTLFNLRQWRKSVAFVMHLRQHPSFFWLRYEDLVADPVSVLNPVLTALGVSPYAADAFAEGIRTNDGSPWHGNSSYGDRHELDASSVGRYQAVLPPDVQRFTEALCYPELRYLGYDTRLRPADLRDVIAAFREPYPCVREDLRDRFADPRRIEEELERVRLLQDAAASLQPYFLFDDVHRLLRRTMTA
jgi:hypothetical protein